MESDHSNEKLLSGTSPRGTGFEVLYKVVVTFVSVEVLTPKNCDYPNGSF